jgi:integrase
VKKLKPTRKGRHHSWTEDEIKQFEARHPVGSRPRLALALLLYSGQRKSDVARMGPQHVRDGTMQVRQDKPMPSQPFRCIRRSRPSLPQAGHASLAELRVYTRAAVRFDKKDRKSWKIKVIISIWRPGLYCQDLAISTTYIRWALRFIPCNR